MVRLLLLRCALRNIAWKRILLRGGLMRGGGCFCCLLCAGGEDWPLPNPSVPDCCAIAGSANPPAATASSATERATARGPECLHLPHLY